MYKSFLTLLLLSARVKAQQQPAVHDAGLDITYHGILTSDGAVENFHNIHFAEDTSGKNRFAPPIPLIPPPRGSIVDATQRGAVCAQLALNLPLIFSKPEEVSEDCLSIFIARPANLTAEGPLPVLAWIHGGGALYGSGTDPHTNPDKLIKLSVEIGQPVLFVAINYRLGVFGFAASDDLHSQKSENVGLRDQRLGLEWVQSHIPAFGGDPDRITSYGLSAGGTFTSLHHISYGGEKGVPFTQAYMMSGPTGTAINQTTDGVKINTAAVADRLGCPISGQEMLDCMRGVDMQKLIDISYGYAIEHHPPMGLHTYIPIVDDEFIPERASTLLREGRFAKNIPTILAWTEDDGAMNIPPASQIYNEESLLKELKYFTSPMLSPSQMQELLEHYPTSDFEEMARAYDSQKPNDAPSVSPHWYRASAFVRDLFFVCSSIDFTQQMYTHTRSSGLNNDFDNVYHYQLNQSVMSSVLAGAGMDYMGVVHGSDTHYIFNGLFPEGELSKDDENLSRQFAASVINFAHTGAPVSKIEGETFDAWQPAYDAQTQSGDFMPSDFNILIIGGPHGTNSVHLSKRDEQIKSRNNQTQGQAQQIVSDGQQVLMDSIGRMTGQRQAQAKSMLEKQKIFGRCEFINSLAQEFGV